jgi:hypothetical protein
MTDFSDIGFLGLSKLTDLCRFKNFYFLGELGEFGITECGEFGTVR